MDENLIKSLNEISQLLFNKDYKDLDCEEHRQLGRHTIPIRIDGELKGVYLIAGI